MIEQIESGIAFVLAATLALAGVLKFAGPGTLVTSLERLIPGTTWVARAARTNEAVRSLGAFELGAAVALAILRGWSGTFAAAVVAALTTSFVFVLRRAVRLGVSCGCFGRLGQTSAGGRELGRAVALAVAAVTVTALRSDNLATPLSVGVPTVVAAACVLAALALAMEAGARASRKPRARGTRIAAAFGLDNGVFASLQPVPPASSMQRGTPLHGAALEEALAALRASEDLPPLLAHLTEAGCAVPRWELSSASSFAPTPVKPASVFIQVPLEPGCVVLASIEGDGPPKGLIGCHDKRCAGVVGGQVKVPR